jgi:flagellar motor switch protein FliN/FliY
MTDELDGNLPAEPGQDGDQAIGADVSGADGNDAGSMPDAESEAAAGTGFAADLPVDDGHRIVNDGDASEADAEAEMLALLEGLPADEGKAKPEDINFGSASVSNAEFQQLQQPGGVAVSSNIDLLMDVDLPVAIELGRTKLSISSILELGPGSVVELNKLAGEPVDLLVNNKVVAKGEVVVVDENFGLRITQLMTPEERIKALADD